MKLFVIVLCLALAGCATTNPPAFIIHCEQSEFDSRTLCNCILIKHECCDDTSLVAHELTHVKQFYRTFGLHSLLYTIDNKYRLNAEVEAYRAQLSINCANPTIYKIDDCINTYATALCNMYGLTITYYEAVMLVCQIPALMTTHQACAAASSSP